MGSNCFNPDESVRIFMSLLKMFMNIDSLIIESVIVLNYKKYEKYNQYIFICRGKKYVQNAFKASKISYNVKHLLSITKEYKNLKQLVILNIFIEMN